MFYATYNQHFPSESEERAGYWVRFGEHCGDAMTHKISDHDTQKIFYRSAVRPKKLLLKLLITRGNITLIPRVATQEKEKEILNPQPEKLKKNEKENKNMK